jgi:hypothetical protein
MTTASWPTHRPYTYHRSAKNWFSDDEWSIVFEGSVVRVMHGTKSDADHIVNTLNIAYTLGVMEGERNANIQIQPT